MKKPSKTIATLFLAGLIFTSFPYPAHSQPPLVAPSRPACEEVLPTCIEALGECDTLVTLQIKKNDQLQKQINENKEEISRLKNRYIIATSIAIALALGLTIQATFQKDNMSKVLIAAALIIGLSQSFNEKFEEAMNELIPAVQKVCVLVCGANGKDYAGAMVIDETTMQLQCACKEQKEKKNA